MKQKMVLVTFLLVWVCATLAAQVDNKIPRLRITASGGVGYLTAKGKENMDGFINKEKINQLEDDLRWATHLNGDIHYLFRSGLGIGAKYIFHKTSGKAEGVITNYMEVSDYLQQPHYTVTDMSEKDYINYLGLSLGAFLGYINKIKITDGTTSQEQKLDKESRYNASNIHLTLGLRYYLNR